MKKTLIIGHSHLWSLKAAQAKQNDERLELYFLNQEENISSNQLISHKFISSNYHSVIFSVRGGYHNVFGLVNFPQPFDFYLPEQPSLPVKPGVNLLPVNLVSKILERGMDGYGQFRIISELTKLFKNNKLYHLESPPPLPTEHVLNYPGPFEKKFERSGVSPAEFRYKLWRLHSKIVREKCEQLGITFIESPKEAQDSNGILQQKYCNPVDPTHANALYGDLVLNQIRALNDVIK